MVAGKADLSRASPSPCSSPLVGAFGAARNHSWLDEYLAGQGCIVAGVSPEGESWVYGTETLDPATVTAAWLRPPDCKTALNFLLDDRSLFRKSIDRERIGALGHSRGGATAIALAGAIFSPAAGGIPLCRNRESPVQKSTGGSRK